jgi:hypothetical protein
MTQEQGWEQPDETALEAPLWQLAADLGVDAEAARQRRERKRKGLLLAGVLAAPDDDPDAWVRHEDTISGPPYSYPTGVSPMTGAVHQGA